MDCSMKGTRRSFLASISGFLDSSVLIGDTTGQSTKEKEGYPIGLPFEQLWELQVAENTRGDNVNSRFKRNSTGYDIPHKINPRWCRRLPYPCSRERE